MRLKKEKWSELPQKNAAFLLAESLLTLLCISVGLFVLLETYQQMQRKMDVEQAKTTALRILVEENQRESVPNQNKRGIIKEGQWTYNVKNSSNKRIIVYSKGTQKYQIVAKR